MYFLILNYNKLIKLKQKNKNIIWLLVVQK